jgi:hypothetical protein
VDDAAFAREIQRQLDEEARQLRARERASSQQQHTAAAMAAMAQAQGNLDFDNMDYQTLLDFQESLSRQAPTVVGPAASASALSSTSSAAGGSSGSAVIVNASGVHGPRIHHYSHHHHHHQRQLQMQQQHGMAPHPYIGTIVMSAAQQHAHYSRRAGGAAMAQISALPDFKITASSALLDQECLVCRQAFEVAEVAKSLPCLHQYHSVCIDQWLVLNRTCPVCKTAINQ